MKKSARIIAAFALGASAGALLGLLLKSSKESGKINVAHKNEGALSALIQKLLKKRKGTADKFIAEEEPGEFEEA